MHPRRILRAIYPGLPIIGMGVLIIAMLLVSHHATAAPSAPDQRIPADLAASDWHAIQVLLATQNGYLKSPNPDTDDEFGISVAVDGDTVVVGVRYEDSNGSSSADNSMTDAGAAYVFVQQNSAWVQQAYLKASNPDVSDFFGYAVAISGDTLVVGAYGEDNNGSGPANNSAPQAGAAYVFVRQNDDWTQQAYIKASNPDVSDQFGATVAISGDTIVVGAAGEDSNGSSPADNSLVNSGAAYAFARDLQTQTWSQQAYLKAGISDAEDNFGYAVDIDGDKIAISATGEDSNGTSSLDDSASAAGAAYVFVLQNGAWSQQDYIKASNPEENDLFGTHIAISGDTLVVGAIGEDSNGSSLSDNSASTSGAAYVFVLQSTTWTYQAYLKASNAEASDFFGIHVAISADTIVVGAIGEDSNGSALSNNSTLNAGAAYVFVRQSNNWTQQDYLKAANADVNDSFGTRVAISGDTIVVGATQEDSNGSDPNDV